LVVDDEPNIRFIVRKMLEKEGHEVVEAGDGKAGLEMSRKARPDLVLLDVMMPGLDGWETCRQLKGSEETRDITVAMLTVKSRDEDKIKSLDEAVADWHISKPFTVETLTRTVRWLLDSPIKRA